MPKIILSLLLILWVRAIAFDVEQVKQEITAQLSQELVGYQSNNPILILIGGYPGAGKTTLIDSLAQTHNLVVISWNAIRQALLDRHLRGSPHDWEIIESVNRNLFKICLQHHANIIIDANAHATNIQLFEKLLEDHRDVYQVVKICLNPSFDTLLKRVRARVQREDVHQGTEIDLLKDIDAPHKKIDKNDYDLIIKNDEYITLEAELNIVHAFLQIFMALPVE
jgi:deoxyadenosine/deoxycytidine kinase